MKTPASERADFAEYLRQCTDKQVQGVCDNERQAGRRAYTTLAEREAARRGLTLDRAPTKRRTFAYTNHD